MTLEHRIKRWLGYDTTKKLKREMPVYEYEVRHTNGEVSTELGHGYNVDGAFARFYTYHDVFVFSAISYSVSASGQEITRVLESIQEIKQKPVGTTTFTAVVDLADGSIIETDVETVTLQDENQDTLV